MISPTIDAAIPRRPTILVVDDTPANLALLNSFLKDCYRVQLASSGLKALQLIKTTPPDLVLLDVMMPEMDGYEVCRRLKSEPATRQLPVLFLTAKTDPEEEERGLAVGAVDFIHKPISLPIVAARIKTHLQIKAWQDFLQDQNAWLQREVERRFSEINHLQDASIFVMISLAEFRDECTGNHIRRTQEYVRLLAQEMVGKEKYADVLVDGQVELIVKSAPLHDIGKIAIPDEILLKPGKLTEGEFETMKAHAERGYEILTRAGEHMGDLGEFLSIARDIARYHHERWDGTGYPAGLAGESIPFAARLMAVADVLDALLSKRPYKDPMPFDQAVSIIVEGKGSQFDPDVVDCFLSIRASLKEIVDRWTDE